MAPNLFLSHNSSDKPFVRRLAGDLRAAGVRVWLDEAEIRVGDSLIAKIADAIADAEYLGVVLSSRSVKSAWVEKELNIALSREIGGQKLKVLPILMETCELPLFLQDKFFADFRTPALYDNGMHLLLRSMGVGPAPELQSSTALTLECLSSFLVHRFPERDQSDWNDRAHLLEQLNKIEIRTLQQLDDLIWRAEPALEKLESGLTHRMLGRLAATGAVRSAMWSVDQRAADTCIAGRQQFRKFNQFVRSGRRSEVIPG